jgi:hypothetical protein
VTLYTGGPTPSYAPRLPGKNKSRERRYKICSSDSSLSCWYHCLAGQYGAMPVASAPDWRTEIEAETVYNNTKINRPMSLGPPFIAM